jgi:hypothetical protein
MPGRLRKLGLACAIVLTIGGCGGDDDATIPRDDASQMLSLLDSIEAEAQNGNCDEAEERATTFAETVDQLPEDVDPKVRQGLSEASVKLVELTGDPTECTDGSATGEDGQEPAVEEPAPVEEEEPVTTTEEPETTTEEEPEEDEQEEEPTPAEEPANEGNGPPLETPSGNTPGSGDPRAPESGGLEPERAETP